MKGRMFVVNEVTLESTQNSGIASIITPQPTGRDWLKTISDIMADMLQIEIGDYIFLWETRNTVQKSRIHGVYRAISKPYFECTSNDDNRPFKIHIEKAYDFSETLNEYDVLNCPYIRNPLWTIVGKKVAGKSRGTSPLSHEEIKYLIALFIGKNPNYEFNKYSTTRIVNVPIPLRIDYTRRGDNPTPVDLNAITPNNLNFINNRSVVHFEKIIEVIFNQELADKNEVFYQQLGIDVNKIIWFSNYLPYSIEQSEMDYVIIESEDGFANSKIYVIEFQRDRIDGSHIKRCLLYSKWVNDTLALGTSTVQPILICNKSYDFINGETRRTKMTRLDELRQISIESELEYITKPLIVFEYDFSNHTPRFIRKK